MHQNETICCNTTRYEPGICAKRIREVSGESGKLLLVGRGNIVAFAWLQSDQLIPAIVSYRRGKLDRPEMAAARLRRLETCSSSWRRESRR
jgi:hypothetical protein